MRSRTPIRLHARPFLALLVLSSSHCATAIAPLFEAARGDALRSPPPVAEAWAPDAVLTLSSKLVQRLVDESLQAQPPVQHRIQLASPIAAVPSFSVTSVQLEQGQCERCVRIDATMTGTLALESGLGDAEIPAEAHIIMDARFSAREDARDWTILLEVEQLVSTRLDLPDNPLLEPVARPILDWLQEDWVSQLPPIEITSVGGEDWPIRAMRAHPAGKGSAIQIELLSSSATPERIQPDPTPPKVGWRMELSPDTLNDLARRAAFEKGELSHSVYAEPTGLRLNGDQFELDLRLWRLQGRGWWRDYLVEGLVSVEDGALHLEASEVHEAGNSRGAALADPLAALVEGRILKEIESALSTSLPARHVGGDGKTGAIIQVKDVRGVRGIVRAEGRLRLAVRDNDG